MSERPAPITLRPQEGAQELFLSTPADIAVYGGAAGGGKILANDGVVLTPFGWKKGTDLSVGDLINNPDGTVQKIVQIHPQVSLPLWRVRFSDGTSTEVAADHLWQAWRARKGRKIGNERVFGEDSSEVVETRTLKAWLDLGYTPQIPVCEDQPFNVVSKERNRVDPYLLGILLGDGCITDSGSNITLSTHNDDRGHYISQIGSENTTVITDQTIRFVGDRHANLKKKLKDYGLYGTRSDSKFIPKRFKYGNIESRYRLVQGLMDTDGWSAPDKNACYYTSVSSQLADDMAFVLRSLGAVVTISVKPASYMCESGDRVSCKEAHELYIRHRNPDKLFTLERKQFGIFGRNLVQKSVESVEIDGEIEGRCITVSNRNSLYITNDFIVTHNSFALLLEPLRHLSTVKGFGATIFRKTSPQIRNEGGLWDESRKIYGSLPATGLESILKWKFAPFNNAVKFAHLDHEKDVFNYQGSQMPMIGFDELTHFSQSQFFYMLSRNRSACGVRPYVRATTNPDCDSWVAGFISWWIDQKTGYPIPERSGVVRWFSRIGDDIQWDDSKENLIARYPEVLSDEAPPKSFTFIAATLDDNKILMKADPGYKANLLALPRVEREQLLKGNWKVKAAAGDYFPEEKANIIEVLPNDTGKECRGWDLAATTPTPENPSPDSTSGVKMTIRPNGDIIVLDRKNKKINADDVEKLIKNTASTDGRGCQIRIPQDPGQAGKAQAATYVKLLSGYPVKTLPVSGDKETRSRALSSQWHAGNVYLLKGDWNESYLSEMNAFPLGAHDDDIDSSNDAYSEIAHGSNYNLGNL